RVHVRVRLERLHAFEIRDVDDHASRDHTRGQRIDGELAAAGRRDDIGDRITVVRAAVVVAVTEGVDVRERRAVKGDLLIFDREPGGFERVQFDLEVRDAVRLALRND